VRLLSERAFDSRLAAVDAATVAAQSLDLGDDEVLAVDLDSAGPVLVLRVSTPVPTPAAESPADFVASTVFPVFSPLTTLPIGVFAQPSDSGADAEGESLPDTADADVAPDIRLQPRFPLFGLDEESREEDLAEALRRVARRMEADLIRAASGEWAATDEGWDARTIDDYTLPHDGRMSCAREEGRLRVDAAERLLDDDVLPSNHARDAAVFTEPGDGHAASDDATYHEVDVPDEFDAPAFTTEQPVDMIADDAPYDMSDRDPAEADYSDHDVTETGTADRGAAVTRTIEPEPVETGLFGIGADEPAVWILSEPVEPDVDGALSLEELVAEPLRPGASPELEPLVDEVSGTPVPDPEPEPEPYRPSNIDFAIWVCADCVYQRTCRKAGIATPATCGNFLWKSF